MNNCEAKHQMNPIPYCEHCDEAMLPDEQSAIGPFHRECAFRLVAGSVGHIVKRCSCYGGTDGDPPGLSKRDAARAALNAWGVRELRHEHQCR